MNMKKTRNKKENAKDYKSKLSDNYLSGKLIDLSYGSVNVAATMKVNISVSVMDTSKKKQPLLSETIATPIGFFRKDSE